MDGHSRINQPSIRGGKTEGKDNCSKVQKYGQIQQTKNNHKECRYGNMLWMRGLYPENGGWSACTIITASLHPPMCIFWENT
jgi:hypothetical protein